MASTSAGTTPLKQSLAAVVGQPEGPTSESSGEAVTVRPLGHVAASSSLGGFAQRTSETTPPEGSVSAATDIELFPELFPSLDAAPVSLETTGVTPQMMPPEGSGKIELRDGELWEKATLFKLSIAAKLRTAGLAGYAAILEGCHTEQTFAQCDGCHAVKVFLNRCDRLYCPQCQPKLTRLRQDGISWWVKECKQAKHVVLTVRNSASITSNYLRWVKEALTRLRRRKFCRNWVGGFYSLEITNEGKGWHVHLHLLVEARWIDARQLAIEWGECVGQDFGIVWVKDARESNYVKELTKYIAKGSQVAAWQPGEIADFVLALERVRTFGVFGSLYRKRTEFSEWIKSIRDHKPRCTCGCDKIRYYSRNEWTSFDCVPAPTTLPRPPRDLQGSFALGTTTRTTSNYDVGA